MGRLKYAGCRGEGTFVFAAQVLHTRSCSGMGLHFVRFLVACYLSFNMDYSSVTLALASLPPTMPPRRLTSGALTLLYYIFPADTSERSFP